MPSNGAACSSAGDLCDEIIPCNGRAGAIRVDTCECLGGTWSCSIGVCDQPPEDAGDVMCPTSRVNDRDPCATRQGGLMCPGLGMDCDGRVIAAPCWCTGLVWACQQPLCDAGAPEAGVCSPGVMDGVMCDPMQVGASCEGSAVDCEGFTVPTTCQCTDIGWSCVAPPCGDGGGPDVIDESDAGPATDASDAPTLIGDL